MPYVKIWLHCVWNTKCKKPFLTKEVREKLFSHIKEYSISKNIYIDSINGFEEHVHCLISLGTEQSISKVINLLKGESSHWINSNDLVNGKFAWQDDYFVISVSESILNKVRYYIINQEEHHKRRSFNEELEEIMIKFGFKELG